MAENAQIIDPMTTPVCPPHGNGKPRTPAETLAEQLRVLFEPAQVIELRALDVQTNYGRPYVEAGFFDTDHLLDLAKAALQITNRAVAVYFTLNPLEPAIHARRYNRIARAGEGELAKDTNVLRRRLLLVDADPVRPAKISATDAEKANAEKLVREVRDELQAAGWPEPILGDSGNGYHLLYRIDLPADDGGLVKSVLDGLAARFDTDTVKIDTSVHNPSRVCKLPGTMARKGDSTPDRPHRQACFLEVPDELVVVPRELLEAAANTPASAVPTGGTGTAEFPDQPDGQRQPPATGARSRLLVGKWLADRRIAYREKKEKDARGRTVYVLKECPFDSSHGDPDSCVMQAGDGAMSAKCFHNSCSGRGWQDFKGKIGAPEPHHYDPPWMPKAKSKKPKSDGSADAPDEAIEEAVDVRQAETDQAQAKPQVAVLRNYVEVEVGKGGEKRVVKIGVSLEQIWKQCRELTGGWPKRVGALPFVRGGDGLPLYLESDNQMYAAIASLIGGKTHTIDWIGGRRRATQGQFASYVPQVAQNYAAVEEYPHWPQLTCHYYMHPQPKPSGGKALLALLERLNPATLIDADLILAYFLTLVWGGLPGRRPAFLFTTADGEDAQRGRGAGKTTIPKIGGRLFGGSIQATANDDFDRLKTRMLTPSALKFRQVVLDNIKSFKLSDADLESLITCDAVSGHRMYHGEAQRPNTLVYCLTINGASLSRDVAQRVIPIVLRRPKYSGNWEEDTLALVESQRWEIIGDLISVLQEPSEALARYSRWGSWEADVLAHVGDPNGCQRAIAERQAQYDEDQAEADVVADWFREKLRERDCDPDTACVWMSAAMAAMFVNGATNERRPTNKATAYLASLSIAELRRSNQKDRGWCWTGAKSSHGTAMTPVAKLHLDP